MLSRPFPLSSIPLRCLSKGNKMGSNTPPIQRKNIAALLGPGFERVKFDGPQVLSTAKCKSWDLDELVFISDTGESVPALFLRPPEGHPKVPAVVYAHAHGNRYDLSCNELTDGRSSLQGPYAADLVDLGIAALCIEMPCFGSRQSPNESERAKALLWQGDTLFGRMLGELRSGIDYLAEHHIIDPKRIGALGFSMGSTLAWWLATLDPRIRAASALCSFADLETLVESGGHDGHGIYMMVPKLLSLGQIAGLAAPRALQICVGLQDWSTPEAAFSIARKDLEDAYAAKNAQNQLSCHIEPKSGHVETAAMRGAVLAFLKRSFSD